MLTHLETRTRRGLWWKLIRRRHRRLLRIAAVAAGVDRPCCCWPVGSGRPSPARRPWRIGSRASTICRPENRSRRRGGWSGPLPSIASRRWPTPISRGRGTNWDSLSRPKRSWRTRGASRYNPKRIVCLRRLPWPYCMDSRSRRARSWYGAVCCPIWRSSTIDWDGPQRQRSGNRLRRSSPNHPAAHLHVGATVGEARPMEAGRAGIHSGGDLLQCSWRCRYGARRIGPPRLRAGGKRRSGSGPHRPAFALQPATSPAEYRLWALRANRHADVGPGRQFRAALRSDPLCESGLRPHFRTGQEKASQAV